MTKHFIFIFTLLCSLQLHAGVQPIQKDTVQYAVRYESMELLQPLRSAILTELCFRCRGAATGLSASQVEQPLFSVHHLVAKTFSED